MSSVYRPLVVGVWMLSVTSRAKKVCRLAATANRVPPASV